MVVAFNERHLGAERIAVQANRYRHKVALHALSHRATKPFMELGIQALCRKDGISELIDVEGRPRLAQSRLSLRRKAEAEAHAEFVQQSLEVDRDVESLIHSPGG